MTTARPAAICLRGVRQNNLKGLDLDLPLGRLVVVTGLSGSGKSSLAFDTLFAEGQRRYIETFSPYARQFFDRMDKPQADRIDGIPPAIAIEQRNTVKTTRSTVGTMTEICEYMKQVWRHVAQLHCRQCGRPVRPETPRLVWESVTAQSGGQPVELLVTFNLPLTNRLSLEESLGLIARQGYQRLWVGGEVVRVEEVAQGKKGVGGGVLTVVQDRLRWGEKQRARLAEACEHAYHFGKGRLAVRSADGGWTRHFSRGLHCAACDLEYGEPSAALFSFNHPAGACPACRGFGRIITIDYDKAIPDRSKSIREGAIKPWQSGHGVESQQDLLRFCRRRRVPTDVPFERLREDWQRWVIDGDPDYGAEEGRQWPQAWYGLKGYFRWLESKAYKMHVRVLLSRYRAYATCPDCQGNRFQPLTLLFKVAGEEGRLFTLADFYQQTVDEAVRFVSRLAGGRSRTSTDPVGLALQEVHSRLGFLAEVGLGYLTLDRPTRTLSGGETERVNLTTCLGTRLVNTLFVLDEPSVGLHPRDTVCLVRVLESLRDIGNTVVVVEHEPTVMRAADQIIDLGPGHGESGGQLVFQGSYAQALRSRRSLTGQYLSGALKIALPERRPVSAAAPFLRLRGATRHNLKNLTVELPLNRLVCLTGVSGSGKTTLAREVLLPALESHLQQSGPGQNQADEESEPEEAEIPGTEPGRLTVEGTNHLRGIVLVDQSSLGKTPRSNPAVYIGAFDEIRNLFAQTDLARQRGMTASAFSFNSGQGQCERCRGAGFEKIEMQFLSDVYVRCAECQGRRYRAHVLEVKLADPAAGPGRSSAKKTGRSRGRLGGWSVADILDATADEVIGFLSAAAPQPAGRRAVESLRLLQEVGLGYLRLGQPINTLSGGESQRLKLVKHLAQFTQATAGQSRPTLFVFDEPTTGLHFDDVRVLLGAFQRLVNAGHSLLVIEHNLDVIKSADWVIDLGPEAGAAGGEIVVAGPPEQVAACPRSHTGAALAAALSPRQGGGGAG